jgi:hypothetical protein
MEFEQRVQKLIRQLLYIYIKLIDLNFLENIFFRNFIIQITLNSVLSNFFNVIIVGKINFRSRNSEYYKLHYLYLPPAYIPLTICIYYND